MGGVTSPSNISSVRVSDHQAYHRLFGAGDPYVFAKTLNEIWIDPDYVLIPLPRDLYIELKEFLKKHGITMP